ncbi:MAG: hypothetical protein FWG66_06055 [Spirochaetes bacterium]|nr:hypothetical protein [Spirochaetota bacterium]
MKPAEVAGSVNKIFEKALPLFPIAGVVLGFLFPQALVQARPLVPWVFALMTLSGALKLRVREIRAARSLPLAMLLFFVSSRIIMPLAVLAVSSLVFPNDPYMVLGFVFLYSIPTAVTGFIWVTIFKGDLVIGLALILVDTLLSPVLTPLTVMLLLGAAVELDTMGMVTSLFLMIVLPTFLGVLFNEASRGKVPELALPYLSPLSKLCIIVVVSSNAAAASGYISFADPGIWMILAACVSFNIMGFICGKLMGRAGRLAGEKQTPLFIATGLKNNNAAMTLGVDFLPMAAVLPAVLGIMVQHSVAAIMGRILVKKKT